MVWGDGPGDEFVYAHRRADDTAICGVGIVDFTWLGWTEIGGGGGVSRNWIVCQGIPLVGCGVDIQHVAEHAVAALVEQAIVGRGGQPSHPQHGVSVGLYGVGGGGLRCLVLRGFFDELAVSRTDAVGFCYAGRWRRNFTIKVWQIKPIQE